jgi:hypothetical protein
MDANCVRLRCVIEICPCGAERLDPVTGALALARDGAAHPRAVADCHYSAQCAAVKAPETGNGTGGQRHGDAELLRFAPER